jgi:hypothetical protein
MNVDICCGGVVDGGRGYVACFGKRDNGGSLFIGAAMEKY